MKNLLHVALVVFGLMTMLNCETLPQEGEGRGRDPYAQDGVDSQYAGNFEVRIFEHSGFRGRSEVYQLQQNQRHVLIEFVGWGLNDRISSIECGPRVGIALFRDRDFRGPVAIYDRSTNMVDGDINDWASSAIVFDLDFGGPAGVWLGQGGGSKIDVYNTTGFHGNIRFYPMVENGDYSETEYRLLRDFNDQAEWVVLGPAPQNVYRRSSYRGRNSGYNPGNRGRSYGYRSRVRIEAYLYEHSEFRGQSISLPQRGSRGNVFNLDRYNFQRKASSLIIREVGY